MSNNFLDRSLFVAFFVLSVLVTGYSLAAGRSIGNSLLFGFGVSMAFSVAGMVSVAIYTSIYSKLPNCRTGKCTFEDYERIMNAFETGRGGVREVHYECKCGQGFVHKGDMFYEQAESGDLTPFKRRKLLRWIEADSKIHTGAHCECEILIDTPAAHTEK